MEEEDEIYRGRAGTRSSVAYTSPYVEVEHMEGGEKVVTKTWEHRYETSSSSEEHYEGFFEIIENIYAKEGISGFYTGAVEETAGVLGSSFVHIMIRRSSLLCWAPVGQVLIRVW